MSFGRWRFIDTIKHNVTWAPHENVVILTSLRLEAKVSIARGEVYLLMALHLVREITRVHSQLNLTSFTRELSIVLAKNGTSTLWGLSKDLYFVFLYTSSRLCHHLPTKSSGTRSTAIFAHGPYTGSVPKLVLRRCQTLCEGIFDAISCLFVVPWTRKFINYIITIMNISSSNIACNI